jgi:hypothetical protein
MRELRRRRLNIGRRTTAILATTALTAALAVTNTLSSSLPAGAQPGQAQPRLLGSNLDGIADYSPQLPFVDAMKSSRDWISGREGQFSDNRAVATDANGWVASLLPGQVAHTAVLTDLSTYRAGTWDLTWKGRGKMRFLRPSTVVSAQHARFDLSARDGGIVITIEETDASDPIRDMVLTPPGGICDGAPRVTVSGPSACAAGAYRSFFDHHRSIVFTPEFLAHASQYQMLRFMDWMSTNNSPQQRWTDRPKIDDARWSTRGVPVEVMVRLSNYLNVNPWFTIPHLADDDYVRNFASAVRDQLSPSLTAYVEYSNEVWNSGFAQHRWAANEGKARGYDPTDWGAAWLFYADRATQVHKLFVSVFGGRSRLHLVTASQAVSPYVSEQILGFKDTAAWTDSLAVAPYFGHETGDSAQFAKFQSMGLDQLFALVNQTWVPNAVTSIREQKSVADRFGVALTAYEGGQHFVLSPANHNDARVNKLLDDAQTDSRMRTAYLSLLNGWADAGGATFMHFVDVSGWNKWGRWGALRTLEEPRSASPRFDALMIYKATRANGTVTTPNPSGTTTVPPQTTTVPTTVPPTTVQPTTIQPTTVPATTVAPALPLAEERFDGTRLLHGRSCGRGFVGTWFVQNDNASPTGYRIVDGSLQPGVSVTGGGRLQGGFQWLTAGCRLGVALPDVSYVSALIKPTSSTGGAIELTLHGSNIAWVSNGGVAIGRVAAPGSSPQSNTWGIRIGSQVSMSSRSIAPGIATRVLAKIDRADGTVSLWVDPTNPSALGSPDATLRSAIPGLSAMAVYLGDTSDQAAIDDIGIGVSAASAVLR